MIRQLKHPKFLSVFGVALVIAGSGVLSACQSNGAQTRHLVAYPPGENERVLITRYREKLPLIVFFPATDRAKYPIVVFNHGRPFRSDVSTGVMRPSRAYRLLIQRLNAAGYAVAFPVRSGYFSAPGGDRERIACNHPSRSEFVHAASTATEDVRAAVERVAALGRVNVHAIFVGGTSAGGYASGAALGALQGKVRGVFILNGGRCGSRGARFYGLQYAQDIFSKSAKNSTMPIIFIASANDTVIPPTSTRTLYTAACKARGNLCATTVSFVEVPGATHRVSSLEPSGMDHLVRFLQQNTPK